jgi:hypothetical protein
VALTIGFLYAGAFTSIRYGDCSHIFDGPGCATIEKAIMHPKDLLNNKQGSLVEFSKTIAVVSLGAFVILSTIGLANEKKVTTAK